MKEIALKLTLSESLAAGEYTVTIAPVPVITPEPTPEPEPTPTPQSYRFEAEDYANRLAILRDEAGASGGKYLSLETNGAGVTIPIPDELVAGVYALRAVVREQAYNGSAKLSIRVDGAEVGSRELRLAQFGERILAGNVSLTPSSVLDLVFVNDAWGGTADTDRNAHVDYVTLTPGAVELDPDPLPVPTPTPTPSPDTKPAPTPTGYPTPTAPNPSPELVAMLRYFVDVGNSPNFLSGQSVAVDGTFIDLPDGPARFWDPLIALTSKAPAMMSSGYLYNRKSVNRKMIAHHKAGGICVLEAHILNPFVPGDDWRVANSDAPKGDLAMLLWDAPDSAPKRLFWDQLKAIFTDLQELRSLGVPVVWRLFHEANAYFPWWGIDKSSSEARERSIRNYKLMFRSVHHVASTVYGLNNLAWTYGPVPDYGLPWNWSEDVMLQYPGDDVVDIVGLDLYEDNMLTEHNPEYGLESYRKLVATGKPFYFPEVGNGRQNNRNWDQTIIVRAKREYYPLAFAFLHWHSWPGKMNAIIENLPSSVIPYMTHPNVITRDKVAFKRAA